MTDRLTDERDTIAAWERELGELLAIDPSPEFAARVRARLREPGVGGAWRYRGWTVPGAVAVLVAGLVLFRPTPSVEPLPAPMPAGQADRSLPATSLETSAESTRAVPPPPQTLSVDAPTAAVPPPVTAMAALARERPTGVAARPGRVVISDSEAAALRRVFAYAGTGLMVGPARDVPRNPEMRDQPPPEVAVPLVVIEPVAFASDQGVIE